MLRLVIALALGASTQAFVVAPKHRLELSSCTITRGERVSSSSVPVRSYGRLRRGTNECAVSPRRSKRNISDNISMRVRRPGGGEVEIQGAGGETRRVQRRARRRPDLAWLQRVGLQTAAAVVVEQGRGVGVVAAEEKGEEGEQTQVDADVEEEVVQEYENLAAKYEAAQGLREKAMMEPAPSGTVQDKYTQIYVPADGIVIKKTYGFWTWQVFGLIFIQHFVRNLIRKGGSLKKTSMSELNWDHIVTEPEHLLELKAYCCEECGYTLFPARGRHEVFFDEVEDFKCPECGAPRSSFFDANDKEDPHNKKRLEALEAKTSGAREGEDGKDTEKEGGEGDGDGDGDGDDGSDGGGVVSSATASAVDGARSSVSKEAAKKPSATSAARPEASAKSSAAGEKVDNDEDEDDLLDL